MTTEAPITAVPRSFTCLVVEDDVGFASIEARVIRDLGGEPIICGTLAEASAITERQSFDLVLADNHLPDGKAYDWFERLSRRNPDAPVIMITGTPDLSEAIALTRNGLFDYLTKPVEMEVLAACVRRARLRRRQASAGVAQEDALGQSAVMRDLTQQLRQAARHATATVLLTGESGVGKDVAARLLHRLTYQENASTVPYIPLNCAAVPADMFEAELFGAERGAYTGADRRRAGLVQAAQGGTLFLDELAEVPLPLQAKLLRLLEGREFRALGGTEMQTFTGRFVAATNKSLHQEVEAGRFREDLLFRVEVLTIEIPPLRQRREDIPALAERLLSQLAIRYGRPTPLLRGEDLQVLSAHDFPGNVRELRNILERGLLRTPDESRWLFLDGAWFKRSSAAPALPPPVVAPIASDEALPAERATLSVLDAQEYRLIRKTLQEAKGGIRRAAAQLGLSPQALLRRLEKWPELRPPDRE